MDRCNQATVWNSRTSKICAISGLTTVGVAAVNSLLGRPWPAAIEWLSPLLLHVFVVGLCVSAMRAAGQGSHARRVWRINTIGMAVIATASLCTMLTATGLPAAAVVNDPLKALGGFVMAWGVLRIPLYLKSATDKIALALDLCILLAATGVYVWTFLAETSGFALSPAAGALMGGALVGVLLAAKATMAGTETLPRPSLLLIGLSSLIGGMGGSIIMLISADHPRFNASVVPEAAAGLAVALAARFSTLEYSTAARPVRVARRHNAFPYVAAAAVSGLLIAETIRRSPHLPVVVFATVLIIALVIGRQLVAFRHSTGLLARLRLEEERFRLLVQNSTDIVVITELDGMVRYISPAVVSVLGYTVEDLTGSNLTVLIHPDDRAVVNNALAEIRHVPGASAAYQMRLRHRDQTYRWLEILTSNLMHEPSIGARVSNARDITETYRVQQRLSWDASHDALTDLANRTLFHQRVETALAQPGHRITITLIDLDDFKTVNDTLGHDVGDSLLITVARRMTAGVRPQDTVSRLGGDEFAIVFDDLEPEDVESALTRISAALLVPAEIAGHQISVRASFGVVGGYHGDDAADLMRCADIAMYEAKAIGGGGYQRYLPGMEARGAERSRQIEALLAAIEQDQLVLLYQPIVHLPDGRIVGAEALVRWQHPERGLLGPNEFIPLAEESGVILPLGMWVLREATRQAATWLEIFSAAGPASISVNASARQFQHPDFAANVAQALHDSGLAPEHLTIEITETTAVGSGATQTTMRDLRDLGVKLSLDDFGTGASTLSLLADCPVDEIKLDRSFTPGPIPDTIATAVLQLATSFGLNTIAEGVETEEQAAALFALGYRHAQGYHFARPMTPDQLTVRLRASELHSLSQP